MNTKTIANILFQIQVPPFDDSCKYDHHCKFTLSKPTLIQNKVSLI